MDEDLAKVGKNNNNKKKIKEEILEENNIDDKNNNNEDKKEEENEDNNEKNDINDDKENNNSKILLNAEETKPQLKNKMDSLMDQEMNTNEKDSTNPNIPLSKNLTTTDEERTLLDTKLIPSATTSKNDILVQLDRRKKNDIKTVTTFLFFQCVVIFATALSVILTIEKMLNVRIIMKFIDTFLEDEHLIKDDGSPS